MKRTSDWNHQLQDINKTTSSHERWCAITLRLELWVLKIMFETDTKVEAGSNDPKPTCEGPVKQQSTPANRDYHISWQSAVDLCGFPASGQFEADELMLITTTNPQRQPDIIQLLLFQIAGDVHLNLVKTLAICSNNQFCFNMMPLTCRVHNQSLYYVYIFSFTSILSQY